MKANCKLFSVPSWCRLIISMMLMCQLEFAKAATFYWDSDGSTVGNNVNGTGLGGSGTWDLAASNWWDGAALGLWPNSSADIAVFSAPTALLPTLSTVTLASGITVNQLSFLCSGFTLTGGFFTLAGTSPTLRAALGETATINNQILGSGGLTMLGGGTIRLGSNSSLFTGTTTLSNGSMIITDQAALGTDSSAIVVTGFNPVLTSTNLRGFGGGSLVLDGTGGNVSITRDLLLQGQGPISDRGGALISTGNNTLSGTVTMGAPYVATNLSTRIIAADGTLSFTGTLNVLGTAATTISSLGGTNQAGASFYNVTGVLAGSGTLEGSGGGTLFLNPTDSSGFSGTIRVSGSAASGQSVVRIDSPNVLGTRTAGTTSAVLDLNGGILAVLMDSPDVKVSNGSNANVYFRAASTIYADHTPNSSVKDQTVAFGNLSYEDGITLTFSSRNGYGMSFTTAPVNGGNGDTTMANNLQGGALLTFTGNFWSNTDNTGNRTMTISGNGNTLINGNVNGASAGFAHNLVKSGSGTLTITGTASTLDGTVSVSGGTLAVNDWRAINNNTGTINIGSSTTSAILSVVGNNVLQANLTTGKVINLAGTTGGATILANQTGTSPGLILNADFSATGGSSTNNKTLTLGGSNTAQNTINGIIPNNDAGGLVSLTKVDSGTWVLAGSNTYTGTTTITNGILKLKANAVVSTIVSDTSAIIFNQVNQYAGGTLEFVGQASASNVETLGVLTPTLGSGTIKLTPGSGGTASLIFDSLGTVGGGASVNIVTPSSSSTVSFTNTSITNNIANAALFYNGSDFAFVPGAGLALRAPDYTSDADFATSATALTASKSNEITGSFSNAAVTIDSLRINGAQALTMTGLLTIRTAGASNASGGIIQTGGSGSISGTGVSNGGSGVLVINVDGGANTLTLNAPITSTTTGGFTKVGAGTLVLTAANLQTGTVSINEGTVQLSGSGRLAASNVSVSVRQGATIDLNGVTPSGSTNSWNNNGILTNSSSTAVTFNVGGSNGTGTSLGSFTETNGVINILKTGTGAQSWLGLSNYTGVTTIASTGIVTVNNVADGGFASGFGAASSDAGNLVFTGTSSTQAYGGLSFAGTTNDFTDHLFTFNGGANGGARIQANGVNGATLSFTNTGALAFGSAATGNAQGLVLGGTSTGDNRFFPVINDNGAAVTSVYKADAGVWYLEAVNGYSGVTELRGGVLYAQSGTSLPTASNLVFNGGIFASTGTLSRTIGSGVNQMSFAAPAANTAAFRGGFAAGGSQLIIDWGATPTWGVTAGFLDNRDGLIFGAAVGQTSVAKSDVLLASGFSLGTASGAGAGPGLSYTLAQNSSTVTVASTAGLVVGQSITGTNIPSGVYIVSINSATTFTISSNTANTSGIAGSYTDGQIYASSLRAIRVDDNTSIGADFVTISGVISGDAGTGIRKLGTGILSLSGANTYSGETNVNQGTLVVHSLGSSTGTGATSVGTEVNANLNSNAITLGNGGTGGSILEYVGLGETSDRKIRLNSTTGSAQIHADGVGALILTNVANDMVGGNKTLFLRGVNASGNMITSQLSDFGGTLGITVDSSAMWILSNSSNNYTGTTTFSAGSLGIGDDHALGTGNLDWSNGTLFAYGADRTIANTVRLVNNTTTAFAGDYSLTTTSVFQLLNSANNSGLNNNVVSGKALTFAGVSANAMTANRSWTIDGSGFTIIDGDFTTTTAFGVVLTKTGDGVLQLNGSASNFNQNNATTDIDRGTLRMGVSNAIPSGAGFGSVVLSPELANGDTATFDLNGTSQTINGLTASTDGTTVIDNTSSSAASLTFGAADTAVSYGGGVGTYSIQNSGGGALSVTKTGAAVATISSGVTLSYTGTTNVNGGSLTIGSSLNGTTGLSVTNGSTLALTGGIAAPASVTSVVVDNGSTLNLLDGAGNQLSQLTILSLGSSGGTMTTLRLNVGDLTTPGDNASTDLLGLLAGGTLNLYSGNQITLNLTDIGLNPLQTYNLVSSADGGLITGPLGASDWILGLTPGGFSSITIHQTDNLISITTGTLITGTSYWRGLTDTTWNGNVNNWSQDKAGTIVALSTPGQGTDVIFQWDAPTSAAVSTTLEQNFKVNSLTFEASSTPANTPSSVTIGSGVDPTYRLGIAPQVATDGIKITSGGPATVTITAPVRLGADQTWNVADVGSVLSIGSLLGEADVIKSGLGRVTLTTAADLTFNSTVTSGFTISAGTLEILSATALGSTINSNLATISVGSGAAFYYNGAANSAATGVANSLTLAGGTLSAGGNAGNNYYTGTVNVSAASFINMRGSNSAVLTATQGNVVLSGVVSGAGSLTVDSISTLSSGNQLTGTLYFQSDNSGWSGGINLTRGTIQTQTVTGLGTGNITASAGRIQFVTAGGTTYNLGQNITVDAVGGILELSADASGTPVSDMTVNLNGIITIGSAANANNALRISQASDNFSIINISNSIVLGNNASLSYQGSSVRPLIISAVISDGGSGYSLAINDELGGWAVTSQTIRLTGANTFGGGISLKEGTLEFNTVTNIGGAASSLGQGSAINITGTSTLRFMGDTSQSTDRSVTTAASMTLDASGTSGATITYAGAITQATDNSLTLVGTGAGIISGGIAQPVGASSADLNVNSGIWTLQTSTVTIADDVIVTGVGTVLNLNSTGVLAAASPAGNSSGLYVRTGAVINLNADDVNGVGNSGGLDFIILGDTGGPQAGSLNTNTFNISTPRLDVGQRDVSQVGQIDGTGTVTVTGGDINLYDGIVNASLASTGSSALEKFGLGTVTLKGDNSGLGSTGNTIVYEGTLILDYTASNTTKLRSASTLEMLGGSLVLTGNASSATSQSVAGITLDGSSTSDNSGASTITLTPGTGQDIVLNLGAITRTSTNRDGTIRFILPTGTQSATRGFTTSTLNGTHGLLGASGFATVDDGTGVWFATNGTNVAGGNIVALISTVENDVTTWAVGDQVTDDTTGFTGTLQGLTINSLRFNAASGSDLKVASGGILSIASGGILVTANVGGTPSMQGGTLVSGVTELIITQDSAQTFTISSDIRINHAVTKSGSGTLLLTGNNVYTDETEIFQGTLQVAGGNAIGDYSIVSLNAYQDTTLQLLDDETIGRLSGGQRATNSDNGTVAVGTHTLTINEVSNTTYAGFFTGTGAIVKQSAGNLNLTNLSTGFTGILTVAGGTLQLSGIGQVNASIIRVSKAGTLLIDDTGTTRSGTRILDTTAITLDSADGTFNGQTTVRGLAIRTDQDGTLDETVGVVTAASGASYVGMEATTTNDDSDIIASDITRLNNATLNIRGTNLGSTNARNNQFRIVTASDSTFITNNLVGGGGAAGSKNISIVPWAVGEDIGSNSLAAANMGNSLVTYVSGAGFRPLDFTTEYNTLALAGTTDNVRESLSADLTGITGKTINALVLNNAATSALNVTGSGSGQTLGVTSGALLFTITGAATNTAYTITLGGFDNGITVGGTNEYVFNVINPNTSNSLTTGSTTFGSTIVTVASTAGLQAGMPVFGAGIAPGATVLSVTDATHFVMSLPSTLSASSQTYQYATLENLTASITSPLTSAADITKSGRGTLILDGVNTAGGGARKTTINEGVLQIASLSNIGGATGSLVFAGGTLRLGTGFTDDISLRTIIFLQGGATIDTNGNDLSLSQSVGSGLGGLTKTGAGNLTLNAAATYTGATNIYGGRLTLGADNATGVGGDLNIGAGATLDMVTYQITARLVSVYGDSPLILGSGSITASKGFFFGNTGDISVGTVLAGAGGLLKTQTNTLTLSGLSTFAGPVEVQAGTLSFDSITSVGGGASSLGRAATAQDGVIHMGLSTTATTLIYTGVGSTSDRTIGMQGTTGAVTLDSSGTGALVLGGVFFETAGNKTLTLKGTSDPLLANTLGSINEYGLGVLTLLKSDTNTWVISSASSWSGATSINDGILRFTADQNLAGALNFGSASTITTAGTLDLSTASATFAGNLLVQTNTAVETNQILIGAGKTLTIGGTVTLGGTAASSTTLFSATGAGAFNVINTTGTGLTFLVGSSGSSNTTTADFSALAAMNVSLNTTSGILQVSSSTGTNSTGFASLILAQDATITASALTVGGGGAYNGNAGQINSLKFGAGTTLLNVNTLNIGTGSRDLGSITFLNSNGTLTVRAADGVSAAAFNMGSGSSATAALLPAGNRNTFDVSGHTADLLFSTMSIGTQNTRTGPMENLFVFDTGTLAAGNLTMGSKTAVGNSTNVINLGGGVVTIGSGTGTAATLASNTNTGAVSSTINVTGGTVTIGSGSGQALILGSGNTNATGSTASSLNVSGGSVTLATTGATAVTMASASAGTANSSISVTGGTLTVQGDIVGGTGAGTRIAAVTLNGGLLDMTGRSIGASTNAIAFNAQSGTLKNLAELNGGGVFNKTTSGTLYMDGVNSYTGPTTVTSGTLQFLLETALYNNTQSSWTDTNIVVSSGATAAFNVGGTGEFTAADVDVIKSLGTATGGFQGGSTLGLDTTNATGGSFTYAGVIADTNSGANSVGLEKMGSNTLVLTQTSTYTGATTVAAGTLQVGDGTSGALAGSGAVTVSSGGTLSGSGSIAGATVISSGAVLAPGVGATDTSNQTLIFTAASTAVDVKDGGQIQLSITSSSQVDAAFDFSTDALTYLNSHGGATGTAYTTIWNQSGDYDSIRLTTGTFNLGITGAGTVTVIDNNSSLTAGSIFKLLDWTTVGTTDSLAGTGGFTLADLNLIGVSPGSGLAWDTSAFTTYGVIVVVPEPSRILLLFLGLSSLILRRRKSI